MARREITDVDLVIDARAELAEGPVWDGEAGRLIWVDIPQHRIHLHYPETGRNHLFDVGQPVGIAVPRTGGGLALAVRDGFAELDEEDSQLTMITPVEADRRDQRMNDGACDPAGRFWAGTMSDGEPRAGSGAVYRLEIDGEATRVIEGVTISNGIGWSPDNRLMYYVDTATQDIDRFDFDVDTGHIRNRQTLASVPKASGSPDGLAVDTEGCIWVAIAKGGLVQRFTPQGEIDAVVRIPVDFVRSCTFGGKRLTDLYMTTASVGLSKGQLDQQPHAGGIYKCQTWVEGLPQTSFGG